ncbi:MAG: nucleotidyltransferase domain-containing protein [Bdellovibrionaceae bacterium]|nr:nucleotidyltransferase domain-containing protein [Pseudobdellovibrionaceae bacterium]
MDIKTLPITDLILPKIIEAIKKEFSPLRVFLYGSRATGTARPDSDYDFVIVVPGPRKDTRYDIMSKFSSQMRKDLDVAVQVWVYSKEEFDDWKDEFSSIPETALNTGIEVPLG